jgi:hypothetical protein
MSRNISDEADGSCVDIITNIISKLLWKKNKILGKTDFYSIFLTWIFYAIESLLGSSVNVRDLL